MAFLGLVAYGAWPAAVLAMGSIVVIIMCLQFLIYAAAHVTGGVLLAVHNAQDFLGASAENVWLYIRPFIY
jgi:hypothetical protein